MMDAAPAPQLASAIAAAAIAKAVVVKGMFAAIFQNKNAMKETNCDWLN
jgi:hypothetical protein